MGFASTVAAALLALAVRDAAWSSWRAWTKKRTDARIEAETIAFIAKNAAAFQALERKP